MRENNRPNEPLLGFFHECVHWSLRTELRLSDCSDVEEYLSALLAAFTLRDRLYAITDAEGKPIETITELLAQGDVRLEADSFDREREVHRHIGDYLLFYSGIYPEHFVQAFGKGYLDHAIRQGQASYGIVSSFDHAPYDVEAPTFRRLAESFELWRHGLMLVRGHLKGFPGWSGN